MAAAGHPVSKLYPLGGAISLESALSGHSLFHTSKSSTHAVLPSQLSERLGYTCQEEPEEDVSEIYEEHSATPPTRQTNCSSVKVSREPGEQKWNPSEHCVHPHSSSRPHNLAETCTPARDHEMHAINDNPQAGSVVQSVKPASLPSHWSHKSETCGIASHGEDKIIQEAESHSTLACKQPMQLQQCNIITTICKGANSGEGGIQHRPSRCVCISSPKAAAKMEGVVKKGHLPPKCDKALCYGSYIHHGNFEDTFAAYCHPQPIPAPSQVQPHHIESSCDIQHAAAPPLVMNHLTLPRLMSSVSETGLDAKHLLQCCNLNCSWISTLPPAAGPQSPKNFGLEECCSCPVSHVTMTRDMGTMTTYKELRDVGVQTGQTITPHVFPKICLAEGSRSETSCSQTPNSDGGKKLGGAPKSPVKEVKWDAEGMTWEVYGASVDPEELGLAIQRHLELQIKETASHAAKLSHQNTISQQSGKTGCQRKRGRMMGSIQTPACCARTSTAVD
ncbi:uncharacterized protein [Chaetodon trifascialis]|uniref:uncharacterized protein n=1 Tax=Chaetodon trifascialis TaxID=109706 RepID=UPI003995207E